MGAVFMSALICNVFENYIFKITATSSWASEFNSEPKTYHMLLWHWGPVSDAHPEQHHWPDHRSYLEVKYNNDVDNNDDDNNDAANNDSDDDDDNDNSNNDNDYDKHNELFK